jgi:plastocyanin
MKRIALVLITAGVSGTSFVLESAQSHQAAGSAPTTHVVEMVLEGGQYSFKPAEVRARNGDRITFVLRSGAPHNVAFDPERVPDAAAAALARGLPDRMSALAGPLLTADGAKYTMTLAGVPPGRYPFFCMPHIAVDMTGVLIVES